MLPLVELPLEMLTLVMLLSLIMTVSYTCSYKCILLVHIEIPII